MRIDARGMYYRELNEAVRRQVGNGEKEIVLDNVNGQRYIGCGLSGDVRIIVNGVPGNDLAAFMDGPEIVVNANGQDGIANTMNAGRIIVHGDTGDITGHSMRGGRVYIKGRCGYRVGIHMKSYQDLYPVIIIGGTAGDFLGEYIAGGLIIVLGMGREKDEPVVGDYCGTGMHGGVMYVRGEVNEYQLGKEIKSVGLDEADKRLLKKYLREYCACFAWELKEVMNGNFRKLVPYSKRPYGKLYAY